MSFVPTEVQGDSRPRDFVPRLVDLFMAGRMRLDRFVTRYDFADINRAAAEAISGAVIKPVLLLPQ
jgi:aryl-alcohol dehydrogenase